MTPSSKTGLMFVEEFHQHMNSIDKNIKFIIEEDCDGKLPFLYTSTSEGEWVEMVHGISKSHAHRSMS